MPTVNFGLPTPPDGTLVSAFPSVLRDSNTIIDGVLKSQGDQVDLAQQQAADARQAAIDAAGLVGTPADTAIAAAVGATNSDTRHALSRGKDLDRNPALGKLVANFVRCQSAPVAIVFLGSSSTAAPLDDPSDRWTNHLITMMQQRYASNYGAETPTGDVSSTIYTAPGIHGYNLGISGATTRNYLPTDHVTRINAIQPAVVFHAIGSNDARLSYTAAEVKQNVMDAIATIDAGLTVPATHVIIHMHERDDANISARWAEYREEYRAISIDYPHQVGFINIADDFAAIGIPGADPYAFRKTDRVHLEPAGLHMTGRLIARRLQIETEQRQKRRLAFDSFDRANGGLGMADSGQRWLYGAGFTITANEGASTNGGGSPMLELGTPDQDIACSITVPDVGTYFGVNLRAVSDSHKYTVLIAGGTVNRISMFSYRGAASTNRWNVNYDFPPGVYNLRVSVKGRNMQVFIDGANVYNYTINPVDEEELALGTRAGLHCSVNSVGARWNDFIAKES